MQPTNCMQPCFKKRLEHGLEPHLHATQYGFRANKSTSHAIYLTRRLLEYGEATHNPLLVVLLDWEKAFDKLNPEGIVHALHRLNVNPILVDKIADIYSHPTFNITVDNLTSTWHTQHCGTRQGCPLSPYLFIAVMAVLFHGIKEDDHLTWHHSVTQATQVFGCGLFNSIERF